MDVLSTGEKLKALRKKHGLTQEYVATEMRTTKSLISMYESDKRTPGRDMLCRLADLYGVTVDYLVGRPTDEIIRYYVRDEIKDDIYKAMPTVPLYESVDDFARQKPSHYATYEDLLVDYNNDGLFYMRPDKKKENLWVLAEQTKTVEPSVTYLVRTGNTVKLIKGENLTKKNIKNIMGAVKSLTYLY